jgi:hypothetical protein
VTPDASARGETTVSQAAKGGQARQALHDACEQNHPQAAARALLDWAANSWPQRPPRNLSTLAGWVTRGGDLIRELETVLYAPGQRAWVGQPLWQALAGGLRDAPDGVDKRQPDDVPPLYPDWTRQAG